MTSAISVVIPVLNETQRINHAIARLFHSARGQRVEVIVVDGDKRGGTVSVILDPKVVAAISPAGRANQMNSGASRARGDIFLFLHADTILPDGWASLIRRVMRDADVAGGAFDLGIDSDWASLRIIETVGAIRSRLTRIPYGDQAIFLRKNRFRELGGFSALPLMEDVELMRRIKRRKWPIVILPQKVRTSARRWEREGVFYGTLRNWTLLAFYWAGVSPDRLARYYRR